MTLFPLSVVNLARILIFKCSVPSLFNPMSLSSLTSRSTTALGANSNASPTFNPTISMNIFSAVLFLFLVSLPLSNPSPLTGLSPSKSVAAAARCVRRLRSHSGDVKRCTIVTEDKSKSPEEMDGSRVEMMMRAPRCS